MNTVLFTEKRFYFETFQKKNNFLASYKPSGDKIRHCMSK